MQLAISLVMQASHLCGFDVVLVSGEVADSGSIRLRGSMVQAGGPPRKVRERTAIDPSLGNGSLDKPHVTAYNVP